MMRIYMTNFAHAGAAYIVWSALTDKTDYFAFKDFHLQ